MAATDKPRFERIRPSAEAGAIAAAFGGSGDFGSFTINGDQPFGPTPFTAAQRILRQSAGLTTVLNAAYDDAQTVEDGGVVVEALANLRPEALAQTFRALHTLSALALFLLEEHRRAQ